MKLPTTITGSEFISVSFCSRISLIHLRPSLRIVPFRNASQRSGNYCKQGKNKLSKFVNDLQNSDEVALTGVFFYAREGDFQ